MSRFDHAVFLLMMGSLFLMCLGLAISTIADTILKFRNKDRS